MSKKLNLMILTCDFKRKLFQTSSFYLEAFLLFEVHPISNPTLCIFNWFNFQILTKILIHEGHIFKTLNKRKITRYLIMYIQCIAVFNSMITYAFVSFLEEILCQLIFFLFRRNNHSYCNWF